MNRGECRVAVIGGGLSGLAAAESLQKKGYKRVTVFEAENRAGGKLHTIWYKGRSHEFGAMFGLPAQRHLRSLMKSYNIKIDGPKLSRVNYDARGNKILQIPREELGDFIEELDRFPEVLGKYSSLESVNINKLEPTLMLPFSKWCDINSFRVLKKVYRHHFTSYGLGDIEDVPAVYVLRVLNYDNIMSFMDLPEFITWREGVSSLVECLKQEIRDIRLGQGVRKITLGSSGELYVHTDLESLEFDRIIITAPIEEFSEFYSEDSEMRDFLSSIQYNKYSLYAFIAEKIPRGCGCILENLSQDRRGHMIIWNSRWEPREDEGLVMVYAYDRPEVSREEGLRIIKEDLGKLGIENPRLYQCRHWKQGPHVSTQVLQGGFYDKLEEMQGKDNVFLAGEIMSTVSMENCLKYVNYLVGRYF